jgi:hypothetical protein
LDKKITTPKSFADAFGVSPKALAKLGALNPVLNVDTKLFIDPLLLDKSKHEEMQHAVGSYQKHFQRLVKLLAGTKAKGDLAWRTADKLLTFPEVKGTCLGYGRGIAGSSWGPEIRGRVLQAAKEAVDLGISDPDLFMVVAFLEYGVGPDLISDMTTNIILPELGAFTERICRSLKIKTRKFIFKNAVEAAVPINPVIGGGALPVILVPVDILRDLPIATSWDDVGQAAARNDELRERVNRLIGAIWEAEVKKHGRADVRAHTYSSRDAFDTMLEVIHDVPRVPYDIAADSAGHLAWVRIRQRIAGAHPLALALPKKPSLDDVENVVQRIVDHFQRLVENKGLWKELWSSSGPRPEKSAQRIFFAVADAYCEANHLDISPEADSGSGPVDFKISSGYKERVLVEVKLSTNTKVVDGYDVQLDTYKKSESTTRATYLLIEVGKLGEKYKRIAALRDAALKRGDPASKIVLVDGNRQVSASKRTRKAKNKTKKK